MKDLTHRWTRWPVRSRALASARARDCGLVVLALVLTVSLVASARARRRKESKRRPTVTAQVETPASLKLESLDRRTARATVLVGGTVRSPESRMFSFHDDRDRHFIALDARCQPAGALLRCELALPRLYLKAHIVGMTVHLRGREIAADGKEVESLFAAAPSSPTDGGAVDDTAGDEIGWELHGDAGWRREDEADDTDTEEWQYLKNRSPNSHSDPGAASGGD